MPELKLEVGRRYKNRCGQLVSITGVAPHDHTFPFRDQNEEGYTPNGRYHASGGPTTMDLIEEVTDPDTEGPLNVLERVRGRFAAKPSPKTDQVSPGIEQAAEVIDDVNHPPHYTSHPSGIECIQVTEHFGFNLGNAIKYIWRADEKGTDLKCLRKARWYVDREIQKRERERLR